MINKDEMLNNFTHNSVLFDESIKALNIKKNAIYIDGTFGRGGHTIGISKHLTTGKIIAFDKDIDAINYGKIYLTNHNIELIHSDFSAMFTIIKNKNLLGKIDGILLDLGLSSPQLDNKNRGFSFNAEAPLDMRMDITQDLTAQIWLENADEKTIADVLYNYGEERKSRIIAKRIKQFQKNNKLITTKQLADIIQSVVPRKNHKHPATKSFQAIRMHINQELQALKIALDNSIDILAKNGILAIISFHSLEDRMVKRFMQDNSSPKQTPKRLPIINTITKLKDVKKYKPTDEEIANNIRARSAILRVAKKC